ncbi:MAG TPA: ABC transporter ATP-binding protein [Nitrososphaeraceae archaeon]|nr:ABC transporter ATP-binding protein [Nitrososphaeraceae archaeon]
MNRGKKYYKKALDGVSLHIPEGRVSILVGESGSGKTTLARIILRAIDPDSGSIIFNGSDITRKTGKELRNFRKQAQMIHQDPYSSLDPLMKVFDIIKEPIDIFYRDYSNEERTEKILAVLDDVNLKPSAVFAEKYPHMLSGGERQRVAIARSLVIEPKLIIADEPVSMLDVSIRGQILQIVKQLSVNRKITVFYITHDLTTSRDIGDEISVMYAGKIVESGSIDTVLSNPLHPYTQALLDAISEPKFENIDKEKVIRIKNFDSAPAESGCKFFNRCPYSMEICKKEPQLESKEQNHNVSCFLYDNE